MNPRIKRALAMKITVPDQESDYTVRFHGREYSVPGHLKMRTYLNRRYAGWTHKEACAPAGQHAPASALKELELPGSRPPRKPAGHALRGWQARKGKESADQLEALAKYGER